MSDLQDLQDFALNHVKSNRKKSRESSKNLTQNKSLMRAENGIGYENEKETDGRDRKKVLHGRQKTEVKNHRRVHGDNRQNSRKSI